MYLDRDFLFNVPEQDLNAVQWFGGGARKLAIVMANHDLLPETENLLKNIINAIKHDYEKDVFRIIIDPTKPFIINDLGLVYNKLVVFGLKPFDVGLNMKYVPHFVLSMEDQDIIFTSFLKNIVTDQKLKTQLWNNLQQMLQ